MTLAPSGDGIALPVWWRRLDFEGFAWIGRVILPREGENVSLVVVVGWMGAWKFWAWGGAVFASRPEIRKNALSFLRI